MRQLIQRLIPLSLFSLISTQLAAQSHRSAVNELSANGFGAVVAIGDRQVIVGEPNNLFRPGMVYVFEKQSDGEWVESQVLAPSEGRLGDRFGRSIVVDGNSMLIGYNPRGEENAPGVVSYERNDSGQWMQWGGLAPSDGMRTDGFGSSLVLVGHMAYISSPNHDSTGAIYIFHRADSGWIEVGKLMAGEGSIGDGFGSSLAISGSHMLVGAPRSSEEKGGVYHFHWADNEWTEQGMLVRGSAESDTLFGTSVAISGNRAYVGMPRHNDRTGAVAVFEYSEDESEWTEVNPLVPFDGQGSVSFGRALATTEDGIWVGTPGTRRVAGTIHAFTSGDNGWRGVEKISPDGVRSSRSFGSAIAIRGDLAAVGVSRGDNGAGVALVYERQGGGGGGGGEWIASNLLESPVEGLEPITGDRVDCNEEGVAAGWSCQDVDLISFLPVADIGGGRGARLNDIWGWTDPESGREYALIGRNDGTSFVDMTDALHPRYLGDLPKTEESPSSVWRDIKVYRNHAYIVSDGAGNHGMQVLDLTQLRDVGTEPVTFTETFHYDNVASAHNIVINEETGFAYIVGASRGGETCGGGLHMIDLSEPSAPTFAGCFSDGVTGRRGTGYSHDAQCVTYHGPDEDYQGKEICIGANETALSFSDVTDKDNPIAITNVSYPNVAYAHQGWLSDDQRYFYSNDEGDEPRDLVPNTRTLVWDVADLDDPILVNEYFATTTDTDHNLYVRGDYMYQSNYGAGLRILDISDPTNPVEVGYFDTAPDEGCCGTWSNYPYFESGVIAVTGGNAGIFFVRKSEDLVP